MTADHEPRLFASDAAIRSVCSEEAQNRLTVVAGTVSGIPPRSEAGRARLKPCS